ncbi:hypothetical protein ACIRBX_25330 [Kitasatospora sp. NPDC096147]|uniref:hypothetical protein n=1 Tax=Kitasatospora sp. NPDC096147 TaxID=3364093 RepID=UPI00380A9121
MPPARTKPATAPVEKGPVQPVPEQPHPPVDPAPGPPPASGPTGLELSVAAPLEPLAAPALAEPPPAPAAVPLGVQRHQPLTTTGTELVDEDGNPLPDDLAVLFDLTRPEQTVVYPRLRIYERQTYTGSRRTVTKLLYTPGNAVPRAEVDQLRRALSKA